MWDRIFTVKSVNDMIDAMHRDKSVTDMMGAMQVTKPPSTWKHASGHICGVCAKSRALEPNMACVVCEPKCAWCMEDAESGTREGCAEVVARFAESEFRGYIDGDGDGEKGEVWRCLRCNWAVVFEALGPGRQRHRMCKNVCRLHDLVCRSMSGWVVSGEAESGLGRELL